MPDNSSLGLSKSKIETALLRRRFDRAKVAPYVRHNEDIDPRKMLFPVIVGDEVLIYPFGRAVRPARLLRQ